MAESGAVVLLFQHCEEVPSLIRVQHLKVLLFKTHGVAAQKVLPEWDSVDHSLEALRVSGYRLLAE